MSDPSIYARETMLNDHCQEVEFLHAKLKESKDVFVARDKDGSIAGTVMLGMETPPNQKHRADVKKLLVHSRARRRGLARALMQAAETEARRRGLTLLTLDTEHGSAAEPLYHALGYTLLGILPGYALAADGAALQPCAFFYKPLA